MASQKQIAANQQNALKSTGPKSRPGKDKTRFNGLKHGLRAEQVVIPGESHAEFEAERQAWIDDWKPQSHTRAVLVERAAVASWRLRRSVRVESARLTRVADAAGKLFDLRNQQLIAGAMAQFGADPDTALGILRRDPAGCDHLLEILDGLLGALQELGSWYSIDHYNALLGLLSIPAHTSPAGIDNASDKAIANDALDLLVYHDSRAGTPTNGPPTPATASRAMDRLREVVTAMRANVAADRARFASTAAHRAHAATAASVDESKEGLLLHRYEMAHDRSLRATIGQLMALERSGADLGVKSEEVEQSPVATSDTDAPSKPNSEPASEPSAPSEPMLEVVSAPFDKSQMGREGRPWPVGGADGGGLARLAS
jgi:hypothetical protein